MLKVTNWVTFVISLHMDNNRRTKVIPHCLGLLRNVTICQDVTFLFYKSRPVPTSIVTTLPLYFCFLRYFPHLVPYSWWIPSLNRQRCDYWVGTGCITKPNWVVFVKKMEKEPKITKNNVKQKRQPTNPTFVVMLRKSNKKHIRPYCHKDTKGRTKNPP